MLSTVGALIAAAGVAVVAWSTCHGTSACPAMSAGNPFKAGTLEWLPQGNYRHAQHPAHHSREPLWDQPDLARQVERRRAFPARHRDRLARDHRHQPGRRSAAVYRHHSRAELGHLVAAVGTAGLLPLADGAIGLDRAGFRPRAIVRCSVALDRDRSRPDGMPRRYRRRLAPAGLRHRHGIVRLVGHGRAVAGRGSIFACLIFTHAFPVAGQWRRGLATAGNVLAAARLGRRRGPAAAGQRGLH